MESIRVHQHGRHERTMQKPKLSALWQKPVNDYNRKTDHVQNPHKNVYVETGQT